MSKASPSLKWIIWSLAAIFYLYEFSLRVAPSIMIQDLMRAFRVDATAVGVLSAVYFYIYAPMQIPVGVLVDRYGARKLMAISSIASGLGALFFGLTTDFSVAAFGRFLIGLGAAFGFVGIVYVATHWFSAKRRNLMIGLANTLGILGAILGQGPLRDSIDFYGWRTITLFLAIFGISLGFLIYFVMRDDPKIEGTPKGHEREKKLWKNLAIVVSTRHTWLISLCGLFFYLTTATFAGLWGIPYIHETYPISVSSAGYIVSMIFVGWAVGGPLIGILSDKLDKKKQILLVATFLGLLLMSLVIYFTLPIWLLYVSFFLIGLVSAAELLCFSYAIDVNPIYAKGTATAFANFIISIGTAILQPLIGYILDLYWTGQMDGAIRTYSQGAYKIAMSAFPLSFAVAFVFALFLSKESKHESHGF